MPHDVPPDEVIVSSAVGRHLALAPVAFAVTEGPAHRLVYANACFRSLVAAGLIRVGVPGAEAAPSTGADLTPLLNQALDATAPLRDAIVPAPADESPRWSCSIWPIVDAADSPRRLVIEVRDIELVEGARKRQRAIAERLLLGAFREQDLAQAAVAAGEASRFVAATSHDLSMSLDEHATRETVRQLTLPRPGTWCIVDVIESNGAMHRLAVIHPDPARQKLARLLEDEWPRAVAAPGARLEGASEPRIVTHESGDALTAAAHGEANLRILREIGFGSLLIVPLVVRAREQGAITFVTPPGDPPFSTDEVALAVDLADRCAMALDNARLYREADALRLSAEVANESKSHFLGTMSHELRTPLNAIGGFAELIELGIEGPVTERQLVALARIKANQKHLLALISEILNFVRIETGRMEFRVGRTSVTDAISDTHEMLARAASDKGLDLVVAPRDSQGRELFAWADPDRVRQILVNLLTNAIKYTPAPGTITVACDADDEVVRVHIADTGPGVPPERAEAVFEPFVQLPTGLADRRGGIGLGLAISRDLARGMQGEVTLESAPGAGARFTLTLPLPREQGPSADTPSFPA